MKHWIRGLMAFFVLFAFVLPTSVFADAGPGDVIVTLGQDLTNAQEDQVLNEMNVNKEDATVIYVTNEEEHQYLGDYISDAQIGTNAISSTKITLRGEGEGLNVNTHNITWVTEGMYANALMTAGIHNADIFVTAPFPVSGTAGLTGILKAYDEKTSFHISEDRKKVANEELVRTAQLGQDIGKDKATELVTKIKQEMADHPVKSKEDMQKLIQQAADDVNVNLTEKQMNQLVTLFEHIKNLNIDWGQVKSQLKQVSQQLNHFLSDEDTQSFFSKVLHAIGDLIDQLKSWISS
ncbi:MAG TPA: DUF1002 domain-containing protein [Bacillales bacterium]|nr:DUF1002 domain-containing protein [Bacillales bacterium]